jgi:8-oxo-dGTP diphosphatase
VTAQLVVGAVIVRDGRAFVHRRGYDRALFPGCWDIPGGHVSANETALDALRREVEEETGWRLRRVVAELGETRWTDNDGEPRREIDYLVEVDGDLDAPRIEQPKHIEFAWVGIAELQRLMENRRPEQTLLRDVVARGLREAASKQS